MICKQCNIAFYARPSLIAKGKKYCSWTCRIAAHDAVYLERSIAGEKTCGKCRETKPLTSFYTHGKKRHGDPLAGWCKVCRTLDERARRLNPELIRKFHGKYENDMKFRAREVLRAISKRCRREGYAFDLDVDWLSERLRGVCELTGLPFKMSVSERRASPYTPSIDRVVPGLGYTKSNCRVVLMAVNVFLSDWTLDACLPIAEALVNAQKKTVAA